MNKKALDYSLIMLFIVLVALPVLFWRMNTKIDQTKQAIGESQTILFTAPYSKADITTYLEKSAELALPEIIAVCIQNGTETLTQRFNQELDKYINAFNARSNTKLPSNNYELYIDGNSINAIAILPATKDLTKKGIQLSKIGTMWFAPSFTIKTTADLSQCKV